MVLQMLGCKTWLCVGLRLPFNLNLRFLNILIIGQHPDGFLIIELPSICSLICQRRACQSPENKTK